MWAKDKLFKMRRNIHLASESLPNDAAVETPELFPAWTPGTDYPLTYRVSYDGLLYECVQAHISQEGWEPPQTPALWKEVAAPDAIPVWKQPTGAQDAYQIGELVHYPDQEGPVYVCTIANNVWSPDVTGWDLYEVE